jgi:carbonic anhydrase
VIDIIYRFNPARASAAPPPADSTAARELLERGNREFAELVAHGTAEGGHKTRIIPIDLRDIGWGGPEGDEPAQAPFAAVLACSDARVPTEMVFRCACNNLFVVRVAGNVLGTECLGSLRYATHHFAGTLKLLVVLGHARCGAVTAAVDAYLAPRAYLELAANYPLRSIVDRILIAVRGGALALADSHGPLVHERPGYREALTETSVVLNAAWTAHSLDRNLGAPTPDTQTHPSSPSGSTISRAGRSGPRAPRRPVRSS